MLAASADTPVSADAAFVTNSPLQLG